MKKFRLIIFLFVLFWVLSFYAALWLSPEHEYIDTHRGGALNNNFIAERAAPPYRAIFESMFENGHDGFLNSLFLLRQTSKPKMLIIGSSNAEFAFMPDELSVLFPEYEVHNIAIRESNITQMIKVIQLASLVIPPEILKKSVFVIGITFNNFFENALYKDNSPLSPSAKMPNLDKHIENNFSALLRVNDHSIEPRIPIQFLLMYERAVWPFYYAKYLSRILPPAISNLKLTPDPIEKHPDPSLAYQMALANIDACNDWTGGPDKSFKQEQFSEFGRLIKLLQSTGNRALIVKLPLRSDFENVKLFQQYQTMEESFIISQIPKNDPAIKYLDLNGKVPPFAFWDPVHADEKATPIWSHALWENWKLTPLSERKTGD